MPVPDTLLLENGFNRLKRCRFGPMLYNPNDMFIGRSLNRYGEAHFFEAELLMGLVNPGQVAIDVGANIGVATLPLAQKLGPKGAVVAIEPQRIVFQTLCANIALNGLTNVRSFGAAAGKSAGFIKVPVPDYSKAANFGGLALEGVEHGESTPIMTIDSLTIKACHLIKIDVEGMEIDVIEGARATIARLQPALYVENNRQAKSPALISLLLSLDYRLYWHFPMLYNPGNFFGVSENIFGNTLSVNMLCMPAGDQRKLRKFHPVRGPDEDWREALKRPAPA